MTPRESGEASLCREGTEAVVREGVAGAEAAQGGQEKGAGNIDETGPSVPSDWSPPAEVLRVRRR